MRCSKKDMGTGLVAFERFVANHSRSLKDQRRAKTVEILAEVGIDEVWIRTTINSKGAGYALEALGINVLTTGAIILSELLSATPRDRDGIIIESPSLSSRTA